MTAFAITGLSIVVAFVGAAICQRLELIAAEIRKLK